MLYVTELDVIKRLHKRYKRREETHGGEDALVSLMRLAFKSGEEGKVSWEQWIEMWEKTLNRSVLDQ